MDLQLIHQIEKPERQKNMITQPLNAHLTSGARLDTKQLNKPLQIGRMSALSFIFNGISPIKHHRTSNQLYMQYLYQPVPT